MNEGKDHPYRSPLMDFTRQEETTFTTPPQSAFTRPLPSYSPSLSLLSSRSTTIPAPPPPKPLPSPSPPPPPSPPPTATTPSDASARYRECLRNHAAAAGGHVLDGCGEFMPDTNTPMKCAACGCHRSFHRKDDDGEQTHQNSPFYPPLSHVPLLLPPPRPHRQFGFLPSPTAIAASGGATTESSSEDRHAGGGALVKKRFRTKFSAEQKRRMMEFATRVGWRIQKENEGEMERVCAEIGVSRQVVKVWMHNNKHAMMIKKSQAPDEQMQQVEKSPSHQQQQQQQQQQLLP